MTAELDFDLSFVGPAKTQAQLDKIWEKALKMSLVMEQNSVPGYKNPTSLEVYQALLERLV